MQPLQTEELCRWLATRLGTTPADSELVERFVLHGDADAFAALVERHGGMVHGVCRRLLANPHDVDDVFQATFIVLARRAATLRHAERVGSWLHGVALRVALKCRGTALRRQARQVPLQDLPAPLSDGSHAAELAAVLDEEVHRLPTRYRDPLVLCCLEGHSNEEAARQLHCPSGTVKSRLSRARELLKQRLTRRGILNVAGLSALLSPAAATAAVPALPAGFLAAAASLACTLAERVMSEMVRLKRVITALVLVAITGAGLGLAALLGPGAPIEDRPAAADKPQGERQQ